MIFGDVITDPTFPPLLSGEKVSKAVDPFTKAVSASMMGCEPGVVFYAEDQDTLNARLHLPEIALKESVSVVHALMLSLADSLGALGPPELAVHFLWPCDFKVNAARCGVSVQGVNDRARYHSRLVSCWSNVTVCKARID